MDKIFSPIKKRVIEYVEYKGITKESFYNESGVSASNFKGKGAESELGGDKIAKILSLYDDLNAEWLLTGNGDMTKGFVIQGNKNVTASNISGNIAGGSVGGHMVNITEKADFEKIIREKEIEITRQGTASQEAQRTIDALKIENESLKRELLSKDKIIDSLIKALSNKSSD